MRYTPELAADFAEAAHKDLEQRLKLPLSEVHSDTLYTVAAERLARLVKGYSNCKLMVAVARNHKLISQDLYRSYLEFFDCFSLVYC